MLTPKDKQLEVLTAHNNGTQVEKRAIQTSFWVNHIGDEWDFKSHEYRVYLPPPPYKFTDEDIAGYYAGLNNTIVVKFCEGVTELTFSKEDLKYLSKKLRSYNGN